MRPQLDFLQRYVQALDLLQNGASPTALSPPGAVPDALLDLHTPLSPIVAALEARPLATEVREELITMYERIGSHLASTFRVHYDDAAKCWATSNTGIVSVLQQLFVMQFQLAVQDTLNAILAMVDERLVDFVRDASNAEGEARARATYAHSEYAVAILERAFEHAPNITQAEKHKLAAATGLQPRQVTIWVRRCLQFQNRRNRRSVKRERHDKRHEPAPLFVQRAPRLGPVPKRSRRRADMEMANELISPKVESDISYSSIESQLRASGESIPSLPSVPVEPIQPMRENEVSDMSFSSLDALLEMDNARQCLVFSPLDSLPRLDFHDLQLDPGTLMRMLEAPFTPTGAGTSAVLTSSMEPVPSFMRMLPLGLDAEQAGDELAAHTQQLAESLLRQMREQGHHLPSNAVHIEGMVHSAAMRPAALRSAAIHSAAVHTAALRAPWMEAPATSPSTGSAETNSPLARAWFDAFSRPCVLKQEPTAVPSELWLATGSRT